MAVQCLVGALLSLGSTAASTTVIRLECAQVMKSLVLFIDPKREFINYNG